MQSPIISTTELAEILNDHNVVVVHAGSGNAKEQYDKKHINGSLYVDLDKDLATKPEDPANGGRHPLPSPEHFCSLLTNIGIANNSHVIVYDDKNGANSAARFWWMLKAIGHEKVQVLNGGFQEAERAGISMSTSEEVPMETTPYKKVGKWQLPLVEMSLVENASKSGNSTIVDVRDEARYKGLTEPIDLIAGHIPGAINIPFKTNLNEQGLFKSPEELRAKYEKAFKETSSQEVIVHCGSGVTACHTILALAYAGFDLPGLYVGSWSEWSRNDMKMVTT